MKTLQVVKGMRDILPPESQWWRAVEGALIEVLESYGYREIRTPFLEPAELFARSLGEQTDIVEKEMYTFTDLDGGQLTLRPEGTASVVRAFVEQNLARRSPLHRFFYLGPMFRRERPQKGRFRQFSQLGAELIGAEAPAADVEVIDLLLGLAARAGLEKLSLEINSLGCPVCRGGYRGALVEYLQSRRDRLCQDCLRRLQTNPLRVLDCKQEACRQVADSAPHTIDFLCPACREHFQGVMDGLQALAIPCHLNHRLVRGLDYYTRTAFELQAQSLGAQSAVAGGGRYDGLIEAMGGPKTPAVGFAIGLDRLLMMAAEKGLPPPVASDVFVAVQAPGCWSEAYRMMRELRQAGLRVECDARMGSLKSQLKRADNLGTPLAVILGEEELAAGEVTLRDMRRGEPDEQKQRRVARQGLAQLLLAMFRGKGENITKQS